MLGLCFHCIWYVAFPSKISKNSLLWKEKYVSVLIWIWAFRTVRNKTAEGTPAFLYPHYVSILTDMYVLRPPCCVSGSHFVCLTALWTIACVLQTGHRLHASWTSLFQLQYYTSPNLWWTMFLTGKIYAIVYIDIICHIPFHNQYLLILSLTFVTVINIQHN